MHILVVGAGIAGLSIALVLAKSGHSLTILESAQALAEVGAGVQLTPNTTKWLQRWDVLDDILAISALPESFYVTNGKTGESLGSIAFGDFFEKYGGPYLVIHRADIHRILHEHAVRSGAQIRLKSRVKQYQPQDGKVVLESGEELTADLVVAADGINSHARAFLGNDILKGTLGNGLDTTGFAAFRLIADVKKLMKCGVQNIAALHNCNCIINGETSMMSYKVKGVDKLNLVLSHPDNINTQNWSQDMFRKEITKYFSDFEPQCRLILEVAMSDESQMITNWPIHMVPDLPRWHTERLLLLGDAAHAMPFYLSMGVSMAAEDAAALGRCLDLLEASNGSVRLEDALTVLETVRKTRAQLVRDASLHAGCVLHLPQGELREARNAALGDNGGISKFKPDITRDAVVELVSSHRYGIIDNTIRDWCYAYEVVEDVDRQWKKSFAMPEPSNRGTFR